MVEGKSCYNDCISATHTENTTCATTLRNCQTTSHTAAVVKQLLVCFTHDMDVPLSAVNLGAPSGVHKRSLRLLGPDVCAAMI
jgi:hypothetical protein